MLWLGRIFLREDKLKVSCPLARLCCRYFCKELSHHAIKTNSQWNEINTEISRTVIEAGMASALWTLNSHGVLGISSHQIAPQVRAMEKHHGDVWCNVSPTSKGIPESSLAIKRKNVLALWCLRVSSWEDRALKGNAGHCNNSHRKSARKTGAGTK